MKRRVLLTAALVLVVGLIELGPASRRAKADPDPIPNVTGTYHGTFEGSMMMGNVFFEIKDQDHRRFMGTVTLVVYTPTGTFMLPFDFAGTLNYSPENGFNGVGDGPAGKLQFHGTLEVSGAGFVTIMASYMFKPASGGMDEGTVTATNAPTGPAP